MDKKHLQLGMNAGTASGRLVKDLLFSFVKDTPCYRCGEPLTRETFSIEHIVPWLDSDDPVKNFFDLENVSYSHHSCNMKAARKPQKKYHTAEDKQAANTARKRERWRNLPKNEQQALRRYKYQQHGK